MANMAIAKLLLVAVGLLGTVLADPQIVPGLPDLPPHDRPPGRWRSSSDPSLTSPAAGPAPSTTETSPTPSSSEEITESPDGNISDDPPSTTDDLPSSPTGASPPPTTATMDSEEGTSPASSNRTLVITLSTVLSAVALFLVVATAFACFRAKHGRLPFILRGISPIDDEEIESWKRRAGDEKFTASPAARHSSGESSPRSLRKAPSVIVYHTPAYTSGPDDSGGSIYNNQSRPRSHTYSHSPSYPLHAPTLSSSSAKHSLDLPPAAVLARAPNSRPGLTDETVEGDDAFIPTHRRQTSRLSKKHSRSRSSASYQWGPTTSPRQSAEGPPPQTSYSLDGREGRGHARIYSDSSVPPRLSLDGDLGVMASAVVKAVPTPESEIGRAIG